jgi:hypothetical protein
MKYEIEELDGLQELNIYYPFFSANMMRKSSMMHFIALD